MTLSEFVTPLLAQSSEKPHSDANTYKIPSTVECLSVQTYPFKSTEGELATMICLGLLQASAQKWRAGGEGQEDTPGFLPVGIQSKAACQREGFNMSLPSKKNGNPFYQWRKRD